jgi:hypothetical protein
LGNDKDISASGDELTGGWSKLRRDKPHNLNSQSNMIRTIKSSTKKWAGHVGRMGIREMHTGFRCENYKERDHKHKREVNIKPNLTETGWAGINLNNLDQVRDQWRVFVNTVM